MTRPEHYLEEKLQRREVSAFMGRFLMSRLYSTGLEHVISGRKALAALMPRTSAKKKTVKKTAKKTRIEEKMRDISSIKRTRDLWAWWQHAKNTRHSRERMADQLLILHPNCPPFVVSVYGR